MPRINVKGKAKEYVSKGLNTVGRAFGLSTEKRAVKVANNMAKQTAKLREYANKRITALDPSKKADLKEIEKIRNSRQVLNDAHKAEQEFLNRNPQHMTMNKNGNFEIHNDAVTQQALGEVRRGIYKNSKKLLKPINKELRQIRKQEWKAAHPKLNFLKNVGKGLGWTGVGLGAGAGLARLTAPIWIPWLSEEMQEKVAYPGMAWADDILHHQTLGRFGATREYGEEHLSPDSKEYLINRAKMIDPEVGDTINFTVGYGDANNIDEYGMKVPYALMKTIGYGTFGVTKDKNGKRRIVTPKGQEFNDAYDWANFGSYSDAEYRDKGNRGFLGNIYDYFTKEGATKEKAKTRITDYMQTLGGMYGSRGGTTNHGGTNIPEGYEVVEVGPDYKGDVYVDSKGKRHPKTWTKDQENGTTFWKVNMDVD